MEENYELFCEGKAVGTVQVLRQGLYFRFCCRCDHIGDEMLRLTAICADKRADLGVLVPVENGFGLVTKLPIKRLGDGKLQFEVTLRHKEVTGIFLPIDPEKPFPRLSELNNARFSHRDGQAGLILPE